MRICLPNTSHQKSLTCLGRSLNQSVSNVAVQRAALAGYPRQVAPPLCTFRSSWNASEDRVSHCVSSTGATGLHMEDFSYRQPPTTRAIAAPQSLKAPCLGSCPTCRRPTCWRPAQLFSHTLLLYLCCASVSPRVKPSWASLFLETSNAVHHER